MAPVIEVTTEQLVERQTELLHELSLASYDEFRGRARLGILTDREWAARDELDSIAYLLGEDDLTD